MIQYPIDASLIRDHLYHDTKDINIVLSPNKFYHDSEFKSEKLYGLGYFNYQFQINEEIYKPDFSDKLRGKIYDNFPKYLIIFSIFVFLWIYYFIFNWQLIIYSLSKLPLLNRYIKKSYRDIDTNIYSHSHDDRHSYDSEKINHVNMELEYHYIKS